MSGHWKTKGTSRHQYANERLSAYLDGQLPAQERQAVESHLAECQRCRWELETLQQTVQWTRALPAVPVPRVFTVPVPAAPVRALRPRWTAPVLQGATVLAALLLFFVAAGDLMLSRTWLGVSYQAEPVLESMAPEPTMAALAFEAPQAAAGEEILETVVETVMVEKEVAAVEEAAVTEEAVGVGGAPAESEDSLRALASPPAAAGGALPTATGTLSSMSGPSLAPPSGEAQDSTAVEVTVEVEAKLEAPIAPSEPVVTTTPAGTPAPTDLTQTPLATSAPQPETPSSEGAPSEEGARAARTEVAAAPAALSEAPETWASGGSLLDPMTLGLRMAEIALLVVFVVLLVTTLVVTIRNRREP